MRILKKGIKWILIVAAILMLLAVCILTTVDRTPYKQMPYYSAMMKQLDTFQITQQIKQGDTLRAGWYKVALTPHAFPYPLAGYGIRDKATRVGDTTYVRTFVLDNGKTRVGYVCLDLLIFPPALKDRVRSVLEKKYKLNVYLTATHTHSAAGGWEPKIAGKFLAGDYSEEYVDLLFEAIEKSIDGAVKKLQIVEQAYVRAMAPTAVRNRLKGDEAPKDVFIRGLKFRTKSGEEACLFTFAAHANCLDSDVTYISADYPGKVSALLEKEGWASFVSYAAGAVGSHGPGFSQLQNGEKEGDTIAVILATQLKDAKINYSYTNTLYYHRFPLHLREPHLRIDKDIRIRPWVFHTLLGSDAPDIQCMQVGETMFLGMPCDYSGELMPPLEKLCSANKTNLILTGFNGGYIGYITDDACYDWSKGETMDMNWHGPYNAAYLTEVNERILKGVSGQ
ncbi:neutral/alkaline non-lysosomal ceramidase N-terminal domain-containing protein [Cytophaga aurantiaca]|uniref:neutral/alkaline non-lysosomal ceramidase N-terminal domain-containing protein n=1 Tax=Cytophaga aurantiaca TaxID=29530 RepID=UPI00038100DA|nr:neutral/alkaline non-lysosomal ceramidase N-terminal domain-containing protein [Cytophaga aurantiaca]